jgi:hypothetical protein
MLPQSPALDSDLSNPSSLRPIAAIQWWFNSLKLQHKIVWSFGLATSVAIVGMTTAWGVAEFHLNKAEADIENSEAEHETLDELQVNLLKMHLHQKGSILTLDDLSQWTDIYKAFIEDRKRFRASWQDYVDEQGIVNGDTRSDQKERQLIASLKASYETFSRDLDSLNAQLSQVKLARLPDSERRALQVELTDFNNKALRQDAYRMLNLVQELSNISERHHEEAKTAFDQAESWRAMLIVASAIASVVMGIVLLSLLSQQIAASIEKSATIAEEVIETSNFDLQGV